MSEDSHSCNKNFWNFPISFKHNEHDHNCDCVKCYISNVSFFPKNVFVFFIEYIELITFFNPDFNRLKAFDFINSFNPRSPPKSIN